MNKTIECSVCLEEGLVGGQELKMCRRCYAEEREKAGLPDYTCDMCGYPNSKEEVIRAENFGFLCEECYLDYDEKHEDDGKVT